MEVEIALTIINAVIKAAPDVAKLFNQDAVTAAQLTADSQGETTQYTELLAKLQS